MPHTTKLLDHSQIELTITVTPSQYQKHLGRAAERISARANIKGFRKGKAPFDIVKREVGDMGILEEAMQTIVQESFFAAVTADNLETIGMPKIEVEKVAPGNDIVYRATVALMPAVTIGDLSILKKIKPEPKPIDDKKIEETLDALRGMQAAEVVKTGAAEGTDKLVIDMDMTIGRVPVDGGTAKNYQVYLSEEHYIPGFNEQLRGLKKGDTKEFSLTFPDTHYQKMLAGKTVDFKVTVHDVFVRTLPELSDDFAKRLGQQNIEGLRQLVQLNLTKEAEQKSNEQFEIALFEAAIGATTFATIPEVIIDAERQKMFFELKRDLERHQVSIEQYLADIKKTEEQLFKDFKEQAEKRARAALLSRSLAKDHGLAPTKEEMATEIELLKKTYKDNEEYLDRLDKPEVKDSIATMVQNRKVVGWLKDQATGTTGKT